MRTAFAAAIIACLALPAAAGRAVPSIDDTRDEEKLPDDYNKDPNKRDLISRTLHFSELITDKNVKQENMVPSIDFFLDKLQEELRKNGNDAPRDNMLANASEARRNLKDGYMELKEGIDKLIEARDLLKEVDEELQPVMKMNEENLQAVRDAVQEMKDVVEGLQTDPPEAPKDKVETQNLQSVQDLAQYLEPLPEKIKKANEKIGEAKGRVESAKQYNQIVETFKQKAKDLDAAISKSLGDSRTRNQRRDVESPNSSERVIGNANDRFKAVVEKALKVVEFMEKLTETKKGLFDKAVADAQKSNAFVQQAKEKGLESAPKIEQEAQKIKGPIKKEYDAAAGDEEKKRAAVAKAEAAKGKAKEAFEQAEEPAKQAEEPFKQAKKGAEQAKAAMDKLEKEMLGDRKKEDLAKLDDYTVNVKGPKEPKQQGAQRSGAKVRSRGIKYPAVLDLGAQRVIGEYGEGSYSR